MSIKKQKKELLGWIKGTEARLNNPGFVSRAPQKVIDDTKAQLESLKEKLQRVETTLAQMK